MIDGHDWESMTPEEKKQVREEIENARRQAHEALEKIRPEIEHAISEAHASERAERAVRDAQPRIDRAMAEMAAHRAEMAQAMAEVAAHRAEIDKAFATVRPQIEDALAKVRDQLAKQHIDVQIQEHVDEALKRAEMRLEAEEARARARADHEGNGDARTTTDDER